MKCYAPLILLIAATSLDAQRRLTGNPNTDCTPEDFNIQTSVTQVPAITIGTVPPADLMAVSIPGIPIALAGTNQVVIQQIPACGGIVTHLLPVTWKLDLPPGSHSTLTPAGSANATFVPDITGAYTVHFGVCAKAADPKCKISYVGGFSINHQPINKITVIKPSDQTLTFHVQDGVQVPPVFGPAVRPVLSGFPATTPQPYTSATASCPSSDSIGGISIGDVEIFLDSPEWYTTSTWTGATPPYELVEGHVYKSHIAGADLPLTHAANDYNANLELDPHFQRLLIDGNAEDKGSLLPFGGIEVEWEFLEYPEPFRPVVGDRMSALGYHVVDCGHDIYTEIHPPIAVAVHRKSAIQLPGSVAFDQAEKTTLHPVGTNIFVPGISTDVFVSLRGGETLGDIDRGLHQPDPGNAKVNQPTTAGVQFQFRVYLPPSPYQELVAYNLKPTFKPALYMREIAHPSAQDVGSRSDLSAKLVDQQLDGPTPYLLFSLDLSSLATGERVARRIEAAWVYPDLSGKNWGLQNISIHLNQLKVNDTGDFTSGDWKLWANISGSTNSWTKLIDCHNCVQQQAYNPASSGIWQPGALASDGSLPGVAMLFAPSIGQLELTGYDDDLLSSDGLPAFSVPLTVGVPESVTMTPLASSGDPSYTLQYSTVPVSNPGTVSPDAIKKFGDLRAHPAVARLVLPVAEEELYKAGSTSVERRKIVSHREEEAGSPVFTALLPANLPAALKSLDATSFAKLLRARILNLYGGVPTAANRAKLVYRLKQIKPSFPPEIYRTYLCDLEMGKPCPAVP
jgi:hypothetical protein